MNGVDRAADARLVSWVADGKNAAEPHYQSGNRATCAPDLNPGSRAIPINPIVSLCCVTLRTRTKLDRLTAGKDRLVLCMRSTLCILTHPGRRGCMVSLELVPLHPSRFVPMSYPRFIIRMLCAIKGHACSCS